MPRRNRDEGEHRIRRFQRSRGCKKTRRTIDESNLRLLDLPDDVIREILQFSQPPNEQKRWLWVCQVGSLCSVFHRLLNEALLAPSKLRIPTACNHLPPALRVPFIQSLLDVPAKTSNITSLVIDCRCEYLTTKNGPLRTLMATPGRFANLTSLDLRGLENYAELHSVINEFCRNLPNLTDLSLVGTISPVSDEQFLSFINSLQRPLRSLNSMMHLTKRQVLTFLIYRAGVALERLSVTLIDHHAEARSDVLFYITQYCPNIQDLDMSGFSVNDEGLKYCLNRSRLPLVNLNLSGCQGLTSGVVPHLANYAPSLQFLSAQYCHWLTDEVLKTIVQGQIDHLRGNGSHQDIPLEIVNGFGSSLTEAGARRILEKDGIGELTIFGTNWMVSNKYRGAARPSEASL